MKPDELDESADPRRHRRTVTRLEIEDADRPKNLGAKIRGLFRRRPKMSRKGEPPPPPDDLPEIP